MTREVTKEEAIAHFKYGISHDIFSEPVKSYAKLAIEALQERPKGRWEKPSPMSAEICTNCGRTPKTIFGVLPPFCPNCGASMRESEQE